MHSFIHSLPMRCYLSVMKGRLYQVLHVPPPTPEDQQALVKYYAAKYSLTSDYIDQLCMKLHNVHRKQRNRTSVNVNSSKRSSSKKSYSGADIENMCREEGMNIVRTHVQQLVAAVKRS